LGISRRGLLKVAGGIVGVGAIGAVGIRRWANPKTPLNYAFPQSTDSTNLLPPTASCGDGNPTLIQTEGPFYTPNTPLRSTLRDADTIGTPLVLEGRVLGTDCRPIAGAVLDLWSCDGKGVYDNDGFKLRGHQFTDNEGKFRFETVRPSDYSQFFVHRTAHLHIKLQGRNTSLLTTQLYFPGEPLNQDDFIFDESLIMKVENTGGGSLHALFDFVLAPNPTA
jgi:protocatechuate 3,4-dioxygenase beta subunit